MDYALKKTGTMGLLLTMLLDLELGSEGFSVLTCEAGGRNEKNLRLHNGRQ